MNKNYSASKSLVSSDDSALVIIDVQDHFINKLDKKRGRLLINRIGWLIEVAKILDIPLVVTAEDMPNLGSVFGSIIKKLPPDTKIYNKMSFGLAAQDDILKAIKSSGRKTMVVTGMETDVCIAHSVLGLLELGYKVVVVPEATDSPGRAHESGIERIKNAGGIILPLKSLYYEWVRTVKKNNDIISRLGAPDAIEL